MLCLKENGTLFLEDVSLSTLVVFISQTVHCHGFLFVNKISKILFTCTI